MTSRTLEQWLDYQLRVHPREIDLGLERVREVWRRMGSPGAPRSILVGGTNGKGSTVAFLEAMLDAAGYRVGAYTSPHLLAYNERVRIDGADVSDADLCAAFERIEQARDEIELTYFEFGTLAALDLFAQAGVDVAVLEVGLGGRLDATNIVDADAAIVTTVDLDHQSWLGPDRDSIGREKAGIARAGRPLVIGELDPPDGLLDTVRTLGARVERNGIDYRIRADDENWSWRHTDGTERTLPYPHLDASAQLANAAAALAALHALRQTLPCTEQAMADGVRGARVCGRLQRLSTSPELIVDVAHNPQAARELARWLDSHPVEGPVHAVFGALDDKDIAGVFAALGPRIAHWHLAGLGAETPRGLSAQAVAFVLAEGVPHDLHDDVSHALRAAQHAAPARIVAFGSFFLVAAVLRHMNDAPADMP